MRGSKQRRGYVPKKNKNKKNIHSWSEEVSEWSGHTEHNHVSGFIQNMQTLGRESQPLTVYDGPLKNPSLFPFNPPISQ